MPFLWGTDAEYNAGCNGACFLPNRVRVAPCGRLGGISSALAPVKFADSDMCAGSVVYIHRDARGRGVSGVTKAWLPNFK